MRGLVALMLGALTGLVLLTAGASSSARQLRAAFVTDIITPAGPHTLRGAALLGFQRAVKDFGVRGRVVQYSPRQGQTPTLAALGRQKYDLIFTAIPQSDQDFQGIRAVAARFPQTRFVLPDFPIRVFKVRPRNLQGSDWRVEEASYLGGYLAALMEKRRPGKDVIGSVGGYPLPDIDPFIAGYEAGARKADPGIRTLRGYSRDWFDPAKCKAVARGQIVRGAGSVFNVAGACGLGTLQAAKEKGAWGIGVDVDQSFLGPHILTSVLKGAQGQDVYLRIKALAQGRFKTGGNSVWNLRNGAVGLGKISREVPRSFVRQVEKIRAQIIAGKIKVPSTLGKR
jgi:basic membrane protein A and related proteins